MTTYTIASNYTSQFRENTYAIRPTNVSRCTLYSHIYIMSDKRCIYPTVDVESRITEGDLPTSYSSCREPTCSRDVVDGCENSTRLSSRTSTSASRTLEAPQSISIIMGVSILICQIYDIVLLSMCVAARSKQLMDTKSHLYGSSSSMNLVIGMTFSRIFFVALAYGIATHCFRLLGSRRQRLYVMLLVLQISLQLLYLMTCAVAIMYLYRSMSVKSWTYDLTYIAMAVAACSIFAVVILFVSSTFTKHLLNKYSEMGDVQAALFCSCLAKANANANA